MYGAANPLIVMISLLLISLQALCTSQLISFFQGAGARMHAVGEFEKASAAGKARMQFFSSITLCHSRAGSSLH